MPARAPRAFQARPAPRPVHRPDLRTDGGRLALHPPKGALALAGRPGALVRFTVQRNSPPWTRTRNHPLNRRPLYFGASEE